MQLPKYFYKEVEERLPSHLQDFWGLRNFYHFALNYSSFSEFVKDILNKNFEAVEEVKLSDHIARIRNKHRKKKSDYVKSYYDRLSYLVSDSDHPAFYEIQSLKTMNMMDIAKTYKDMTNDEIIETIIKDKNEKVEAWRKSKPFLFTAFPAIGTLPAFSIENALAEDIVATACDYIVKELKYNLKHVSSSLPSPVVNNPIFSLSSSRITLEEIDGIMQSVIKSDTEGVFTLFPANYESVNDLKTLDKKDLRVYQEITKISCEHGKVQNGNILINANCGIIADKIYGYHTGKKERILVMNSIEKFANRRFVHKFHDGRRIDYVLIDSIIRPNENEPWNMILLLGKTMSDALLQKDIISVSKKIEDKLITSNAAAFIHALQEQRFILLRDSPDDLSNDFSMDFFENSIYFQVRSYKKKVKLVMNSLDDFMHNEVLIENYYYENDVFHIKFYPLDDDDMSYYNDWLKNHSRDEEDQD